MFTISFVFAPSILHAQDFSIFSLFLQKVKGFNVWVSMPAYLSPEITSTKDSWRLGYSIKAGPIYFDKDSLKADRAYATFNVGYTQTFGLGFTSKQFKSEFPYSGPFLQIIVGTPICGSALGAVFGIGSSFQSLTSVTGFHKDTAVRMSANTVLSPEILAGVSYRFEYFSLFLDGSYQFLKWTNLKFETVGSEYKLSNVYHELPQTLDLSAVNATFGVSVNLSK